MKDEVEGERDSERERDICEHARATDIESFFFRCAQQYILAIFYFILFYFNSIKFV